MIINGENVDNKEPRETFDEYDNSTCICVMTNDISRYLGFDLMNFKKYKVSQKAADETNRKINNESMWVAPETNVPGQLKHKQREILCTGYR